MIYSMLSTFFSNLSPFRMASMGCTLVISHRVNWLIPFRHTSFWNNTPLTCRYIAKSPDWKWRLRSSPPTPHCATTDRRRCPLRRGRSLKNNRTKIHRNLFVAMVIQVLVRLVLYLDQLVTRGGDSDTECRVQVQGIDNTVSAAVDHIQSPEVFDII